MSLTLWNCWHGCHKKSEGCRFCYVYRRDEHHDIDSNVIRKTASFRLPIQRDRYKQYKIPSGTTVFTCFSSDFFIEEADVWREDAWQMIRLRPDLTFYIVTKRPERVEQCLPDDWGEGWENVIICCTIENQKRTDERMPVFKALPLKHKHLICEPLLTDIDLGDWLRDGWLEQVTVGGESGAEARECRFEWVMHIRQQCIDYQVAFMFKQTGHRFVKNGRTYILDHRTAMQQAGKANINYLTFGYVNPKDAQPDAPN